MKLVLVFLCCLSLTVSITSVAQEASEAPPPIQNNTLEKAIVDRLILQLIALIFIFFAALLGYRYIAGRIFSK